MGYGIDCKIPRSLTNLELLVMSGRTQQSKRQVKPYQLTVLPSSDPYHSIVTDVQKGLARQPRMLPERYFYDSFGSQLFEKICQTPEYYPTRTEEQLLIENASEIVATVKPKRLIELGCGSCVKTRQLFQVQQMREYCDHFFAVDISHDALDQAMAELSEVFPWLRCQGVAGDYFDSLPYIEMDEQNNSLYLFLGGSIGNFSPERANNFLVEVGKTMTSGDLLLLGVDGLKSIDTLNRAYNDKQTYTEQFNLNILRVINREMGANFNLDQFRHRAEFVDEISAVQISLESLQQTKVFITELDQHYTFQPKERIITEHCYKYTPAKARQLLHSAGYSVQKIISAPHDAYLLILASIDR